MKTTMITFAMLLLATPVTWSAESGAINATTLPTSESGQHNSLSAYPAAQPHITRSRMQVARSASIPQPLHHNTMAAGVLAQGPLEVVTDSGKTIDLVAGEAVIETIDIWRFGENTGAVPGGRSATLHTEE